MSDHQHHNQHTEEKSLDGIFYIVGLIAGLITGYVIEKSFIWIPIGGILGLLTAALFLKMLVKGREDN
jgi:hypothetical protein